MFLLEALHDATKKLEEQTIMCITTEVISKVAEVIRGVESMGIRINWLARIICKILSERVHHELVQNANILTVLLQEVKKQMYTENIK